MKTLSLLPDQSSLCFDDTPLFSSNKSSCEFVIRENAWGIVFDLRKLAEISPAQSSHSLLSSLEKLAQYEIRIATDNGQSRKRIILNVSTLIDRPSYELFLPKGRAADAFDILKNHGVTPIIPKPITPPELIPDTKGISQSFENGDTLDELQVKTCSTALNAMESGLIDCSMSGGKSIMIAGLSRALPLLRPLLITGTKAKDTAQLAQSLSRLLGSTEKIYLHGCAGEITGKDRTAIFVKSPGEATIVVGTHTVFQKVDDATDVLCLKRCKLIICDEAHDLPTQDKLARLLKLSPARMFGLSATCFMRADRCDLILADMLRYCTPHTALAKVRHSEVVSSGRAVQVELHSYPFVEADYPALPLKGRKRFIKNLFLRLIAFHDGRNRFCAELLIYLIQVNQNEGRGTIIAFTKTIEHLEEILRHVCYLSNLPESYESLDKLGIVVHHSKLTAAERLKANEVIKDGKARVIMCTDTLTAGLDCACISDGVDQGGMQELVNSIQRSGRPLRPMFGKVYERWHLIHDTHHPALIRISHAKRKALEFFFGCLSAFHHKLPWKIDYSESFKNGGTSC